MQSRNRTFFRLLDAAQHRFRRARPGSVLIMVVSLLVLLALIGTAAMSTSRLDRTSSLQNVKNVQVDLLAEGVKRMVLGILSKDLAANTTDSTMFDPDVAVNDEANAILASLLPERQLTRNPVSGQADFVTTPPQANQLVFRALSYPPVRTGTQPGFPYRFNDPTESDPPTKPNYFSLPNPKPAMFPTVTVNPADGAIYPALRAVNVDGTFMNFFPNADGTPSTVAFRGGEKPFIAADTDADGVADAMLVKLPITPVAGITYYAAVRVVDNAAKINLNTAANADAEHASVQVRNAAGALTPVDLTFAGIYPASVMLENLLDPTTTDTRESGNLTELEKLNGQRVYGDRLWGKNAKPSLNPFYWDLGTSTAQPRTDFTFLTPGDAMYNNLARMLDYPSISINPNPKAAAQPGFFGGGTRPFSIADSMALAYRFTLLNAASQDSIVEKSLFMTTLTARSAANSFKPVINKPYPLTTAGIANWFDDNFDYRWKSETPADQTSWPAGKAQMMRALLTGFNPVTSSVPKTHVQTDLYRMWYVANYDPVNPTFPNNPPPATPPAPDAYTPPKIPDANDPIQRQPMAPLAPSRGQAMRNPSGSQYPGKANVNTALFEELWQRYFDVMCNDATSTPFDFGAEDDIYQGSSFNHLTPFGNNIAEHAARMFRSPLRPEIPAPYSPAIARMHPYQVMALRAAIAAANTIALRTDFDPPGATIINDRNIPFYEIVLPQVNGTYDHTTYAGAGANPPPNFYAGVGATVYGVKRQPFITEVYVDNNTEQFPTGTTVPAPTNPDGTPPRNRSGFAAIEIHNPYDRPFRLSGWKLGLVDRRRVNTAGNTVVDWQNQTDAAGNRRAPKMQVVDLPDNTTPDAWDAENPNATAYAPFIFDQDAVIPPHGFLVVSNLAPVAQFNANVLDAAQYSPADTKISALTDVGNNIYTVGGVKLVYARKLHWMANREVQLLRPVERVLFDTANASKGVWVVRWAPADSFDATGILHNKYDPANPPPPPPPGTTPGAEAWHYVRSNDPTANRAWHFVYPGRYEALAGVIGGHQQGTDRDTWDPTVAGDLGLGHWVTGAPTPSQFGLLDAHNSRDTMRDYPALNTTPVASTFPIQIANGDLASQFVATGASPGPAFPLNGFARTGDLMQVTYIGSYTVWDADARWTRDDLPLADQFDAEYWSRAGAEDTTNKRPPTLPYLAGGGGRFIDINPVSLDAAMAEDTDVDDDYKPSTNLAFEDVGRFVPLYFNPAVETTATYSLPLIDLNAYKANGTVTNPPGGNTFKPDGTQLQNGYPKDFWIGYDCIFTNADQTAAATWKYQHRRVTGWDNASNTIKLDSPPSPPLDNTKTYAFALQRVRYEWAAKLPNYFTTQYTPADDYLPNVDPTSGYLPAPLKVRNLSDLSRQINRDGLFMTPQQRAEDDVPAEGLININTANWKVISQLPLVMNVGATPPVVDQPATEALARRIVYYRDVDDGRGIDPTNPANHPPHPHGPFKSLYELCLIPDFVNAMNTIDNTNLQANNPGVFQGDFSPMSLTGDLVRQDFKEKYLALNRIANLVTLKSDSFTVYLQVQGWREAGTTAAKLVTQKRLAFIVDRSQTDKRSPTVYNVPVAE